MSENHHQKTQAQREVEMIEKHDEQVDWLKKVRNKLNDVIALLTEIRDQGSA